MRITDGVQCLGGEDETHGIKWVGDKRNPRWEGCKYHVE